MDLSKRGYHLGVDQQLTWGILVGVLLLIATGRMRMELAALGGLLALGIAGVAPVNIVFSGFGDPALATIIAVFLVSQGIINSGLMLGLGQALARRLHNLQGQVLSFAVTGAVLSAFMNNVGAVGLLLPTAVRMAGRFGCHPGSFGLPLAIASLLGGTLTLIGSAPNIIISSYMLSVTDQSFKMFDFAPHGLAMLGVALLLWLACKSCGMDPGAAGAVCNEGKETAPVAVEPHAAQARTGTVPATAGEIIPFAPLATGARRFTLVIILMAVLAVSFGLLHPALGFGGAVLLLILAGVLKLPDAYKSVDLKIVFFLGAMLGMGAVLQYTGGLELLSHFLARYAKGFSPFWLLLLLVFVSSALSNAINNAAAAVFMAPLAVSLAAVNSLETGAALMAVAAGSNMTLLLPTHQAVLMVMSKAPFATASFLKAGLVLTLCCGLAATAVIALLWQ